VYRIKNAMWLKMIEPSCHYLSLYTHIIKDLKLEMAKFTHRLQYYHTFFFYLYVLSFEFGRPLYTCTQAYHLHIIYYVHVYVCE